MNHFLPAYRVGPLLYCPANNASIVNSLTHEKFGRQFSLALCLEDTIQDDCVADAEQILISSLQALQARKARAGFFLPEIFIRVRAPKQIKSLLERLGSSGELITGFNIPKFSLENADAYIQTFKEINSQRGRPFYMMPIFESPSMIHLERRASILYALKEKLDAVSQYVLNIRVGGNDLCHMFGFRRHSSESIYKIRPVADIFSDILTVFGMDYVVSGPVFEYYSGKNWESGLIHELNDDRLCGFIGKTVIHPNQIPLVNEAYKVPLKDYNDAKAILDWDVSCPSLVAGSIVKERMNEYKTHYNWALRTLLLAEAYGLK
ncbi:MAG: HpcH/HpaI aldolase/citrate lyase family protein [Lachnospiraceae bacterium]|nr:HpcH/HpaI aldolase/citrate lyase family protein [Lachnospiraceae bacterium]MCI9058314.1 HpcH/HpaI aldolase/citrate lyase family protein [Lachnospiraceae bacterium]